MNLYQISAEYQQILNNLYDDEGNIKAHELMRLDAKQSEINAKAIAIASYIKNLDAEREAIEHAKKDMADREDRYKKKIEGLKGYLQSNMERCGITHIKHPYFDIKLKKCPLSVDIYDEESLPSEYKREKVVVAPDKKLIADDIKNGVVVPGAALKQNLKVEIK